MSSYGSCTSTSPLGLSLNRRFASAITYTVFLSPQYLAENFCATVYVMPLLSLRHWFSSFALIEFGYGQPVFSWNAFANTLKDC